MFTLIYQINSDLSNKILIESYSDTVQITVQPNSENNHATEISTIKSGYTLLGTFFKSAVGLNWTYLLVTPFYYSSKIDFDLYNPTSSQIALSNISYTVVWVKTS